MLAVLVVSALAAYLVPLLRVPSLVPVLAAASFLTLLGAIDDRHALCVSWRFIGQGSAALAIVLSLPEEVRILPGLLPLGVERALLVIGTIGLAVAAMQALGVLPAGIGLLSLALLGAMLGFAIFNRHPASIFLGDAGSLPIGLCLALMLIYVADANLAAALLLPMYMVADTAITLIRRMINREPFLSAHRSHFYQRAVSGGRSVPEVTTSIFVLSTALALLAVGVGLANSVALDLIALTLGAAATAATLYWLGRGRV